MGELFIEEQYAIYTQRTHNEREGGREGGSEGATNGITLILQHVPVLVCQFLTLILSCVEVEDVLISFASS